jgi:hypothetical protein
MLETCTSTCTLLVYLAADHLLCRSLGRRRQRERQPLWCHHQHSRNSCHLQLLQSSKDRDLPLRSQMVVLLIRGMAIMQITG